MAAHLDTTVLIIEDDPILGELVELIVKKSYTTTLTPTMALAEQFLGDNEPPNIILIDIILPDGNGFDLLRKIRTNERYANSLCVMFTNLSQASDKSRAFELGADEYYVKANIDLSKLPELLYELLQKKCSGQPTRDEGGEGV